MQFHLDGFKPCDPHVADASALVLQLADAIPALTDVLVVGCGQRV